MKKNIYYKILRIIIYEENNFSLEIKNISDIKYKIEVNKNSLELEPNFIKKIEVNSLNLDFIISFDEEKILVKEIINLPEEKGFHKNSLLETKNGSKKILELISGDKILNKDGESITIENIYIFKIEHTNNNYPIIIKKSKCGINLPYEDLIMSIKMNLKVRKVFLKGRNLYLNRKAQIYKYDEEEPFYYYLLETENNQDFLINGFISESC